MLRRPEASVVAVADRKSTRLNSSHLVISYAVFCLKKRRISMVGNSTTPAPRAARREASEPASPLRSGEGRREGERDCVLALVTTILLLFCFKCSGHPRFSRFCPTPPSTM